MLLLVSECESSDKLIKQDCLENGFNYVRFQYWANRSKNRHVNFESFILAGRFFEGTPKWKSSILKGYA